MSDSKARFFLPPDDYEILCFGGESVKDEEKGIKQMMKYYHDFGLTEEQMYKNSFTAEHIASATDKDIEVKAIIAVKEFALT